MQGAVPAHCYDASSPQRTIPSPLDDGTPNRYAQYWTNGAPPYFSNIRGAVNYVNFFNTNDWALAYWRIDQNLKPANSIGYSYTGTNFTLTVGANSQDLVFPNDTYAIFSYCVEARCFALGAQSGVGGAFDAGAEVDLRLPPYNFGDAHKGHSAQFRSTNMKRATFWNRTLIRMGLKEEL